MFAMTQTEFLPVAQWQPFVSTFFEQAFGAGGLQNLSQSLCRPPLSTSFRLSGNSSLEVMSSSMKCDLRGLPFKLSLLQAALNTLNASTQSAQLGNWQPHADVPDTVCLQGSGPHSVSYSDTGESPRITAVATLQWQPVVPAKLQT